MRQVCFITFLEGVRNRVLYAIFVFTIIIMFLSTIFSQFFMQDLGKVVADFNLGAMSLAGLLISFSVSVGLIAKDLDRRTIYFVLGRNISRRSYIFGKFAGLALLIICAYIIIFLLTHIPILLMKASIPAYFKNFSWGAYALAAFADLIKCIFLNTVIIFFSSFVTASFTTLVFSILIYIAGQSLAEVLNYVSSSETYSAIAGFLNIVKYIVPDFSSLDFKTVAANGIMPPAGIYFGSIAYALVYSAVLLLLAGIIFERKEFP